MTAGVRLFVVFVFNKIHVFVGTLHEVALTGHLGNVLRIVFEHVDLCLLFLVGILVFLDFFFQLAALFVELITPPVAVGVKKSYHNHEYGDYPKIFVTPQPFCKTPGLVYFFFFVHKAKIALNFYICQAVYAKKICGSDALYRIFRVSDGVYEKLIIYNNVYS